MPIIAKNKITTSRIFYNRGVPPSDKLFAWYAGQNFSVIKQLAKFNKLAGIR